MELRDTIKAQRLALGLTQEELGNRLGVTKSTINKYELGVLSNPPLETLLRLADALNCSPNLLMGWEEPATPDYSDALDLIKSNMHRLSDARRADFFKLTRYLYPELYDVTPTER